MSHIKFQTFAVVNATTGAKARVHYAIDNQADGRKCVTVYDRDYGHALAKVFEGATAAYKNDTDSMTDYFDKGRVRIFETDAIYAEARKAVEKIIAKQNAKREARAAARAPQRGAVEHHGRVVLQPIQFRNEAVPTWYVFPARNTDDGKTFFGAMAHSQDKAALLSAFAVRS